MQRSRLTNHNVMVGFDDKRYIDRIDAVGLVTRRNAKVAMGGLYGDHRDGFGGGGYSTYSLLLSSGNLDILTPEALAIDQLTAQSNGSFGKLAFGAGRLQNVSENFALFAGITGQLASKNLDAVRKDAARRHVRRARLPRGRSLPAMRAISPRWRRAFRCPERSTAWQLHVLDFVDAGSITINKDPWGPGDNERS